MLNYLIMLQLMQLMQLFNICELGLKCIIMEGRLNGNTKKKQLDPVTSTEDCIDQVKQKESMAAGMYWTGLNETGGKECYATMDIVLVEDIDNGSDHYVCNFKGKSHFV